MLAFTFLASCGEDESTRVPNVVGHQADRASARIEQAGLTASYRPQPDRADLVQDVVRDEDPRDYELLGCEVVADDEAECPLRLMGLEGGIDCTGAVRVKLEGETLDAREDLSSCR